ncbi:MAG: extracellular solute-binding protein [Bacillota bacterium]
MRKSLLPVLLVIVLLVGCSITFAKADDLQAWASQVKKEMGGAKITIAAATHPSIEAFKKMTPEFEKLTGIKVNWDTMEEIYLHDKILTEHTARTGRYDVVMMDVCWIGEFAKKKVVLPLDANLKKVPAWYNYKDIVPAYSKGLGAYDNKVYGIPSAGESAFIAYRKDLFEKYNYDPNSIKTCDDLMKAAKFFNGKEDGLFGISMRGRRGHHIVYGWFQFLYPFGGSVFAPGTTKVTINSPESIASLQYFVDLMKYAPTGIENFSHEEATTTFMQGKAAMWFDATALAPWIEDTSKSAVAGKVGYLAPPKGPAGSAAAVAGWNLAISSASKNQKAAWAFITYMTSQAMATEYVESGGVVTRTSVLNNPSFIKRYPYYPQIVKSLDLADELVEKGIDWRPRMPEWPKMGEILGLNASLALTGQMSAKEAMNAAARDVDELVNKK